jgi:hypothetical protein
VGISTDANGNGTGTVNVFRGQGVTPTTGVLYRAFIR